MMKSKKNLTRNFFVFRLRATLKDGRNYEKMEEKGSEKSLSTWITLFNDNRRWKFHSSNRSFGLSLLSTCRAMCSDLKLIGNLMSEQQHREREMDIYENCSNRYWTYHLATFRLICNWNFIGRKKISRRKRFNLLRVLLHKLRRIKIH